MQHSYARRRTKVRSVLLIAGSCAIGLAVVPAAAAARSVAPAAPVNLIGAAPQFLPNGLDGYAVLAGSTVTSVGGTVLNADLGVSPGVATTGFPPGIVNGATHVGDAAAADAQAALTLAYETLAARPPSGTVAGDLGGQRLTPGTYVTDPAATLSGELVLDAAGDPDAIFVLQVADTLDTSPDSTVVLAGGATACQVHWQVGASARVGPRSTFVGDVLAADSITLGAEAGVDGRLLARAGEVALSSNAIVQSPCGAVDPPPAAANVVFVMVDDLSANLLPYMSQVQALATDGVTFENYFVGTPWCCPSRATVQAGQFPHNTGVLSNQYPAGGFESFLTGDMETSIGVQMQDAGYRTGLLGKYLNGYTPKGQKHLDKPQYPRAFVPPGWDSWFSGKTGYQHFQYTALQSADSSTPVVLRWEGHAEENYYTDVLSAQADTFLRTADDDPFFLMVTPYAPHGGMGGDPENGKIRYPPAPRDRAPSGAAPRDWAEPEFENGDCGVISCLDVPWPDSSTPGNVNVLTTNPLEWMSTETLTERKLARGRELHVQRIQMIQAVNDMLAVLRQTLVETGKADNTYIVFGSDNGYHLGEHALFGGKTTAYDHDVGIPLIIRPPGGTGIPLSVDALVQNTDVLPTVVELAGATPGPEVDGRSMLPLMTQPDLPWRAAALLELTNNGDEDGKNPDTVGYEGDHVAPTYNAIRTAQYLYIDYSTMDGVPPGPLQAEFYDLATDPYQTINRWGELSADQRTALDVELAEEVGCVAAQCWAAQASVPEIVLP